MAMPKIMTPEMKTVFARMAKSQATTKLSMCDAADAMRKLCQVTMPRPIEERGENVAPRDYYEDDYGRMSSISDDEWDEARRALNGRPTMVLNLPTPEPVLTEELPRVVRSARLRPTPANIADDPYATRANPGMALEVEERVVQRFNNVTISKPFVSVPEDEQGWKQRVSTTKQGRTKRKIDI